MREIMVSGYGGGETVSIAKYRFSDEFGNPEEVWRDHIEAPSYLGMGDDMLFAISEREKTGTFYCYKKAGDGYSLADRMDFDGGALCHIHYSTRHRTLYGAFYLTGHVVAASVGDSRFTAVPSNFVMQPDRGGDLTRAHCCVPDPDEDRMFVCNIALDRVYIYKIDIENGALRTNEGFPFLQLEKGEGPRHIRFHPRMDVAYVITEYSNKLFVLGYDRAGGKLNILQEISTLPSGFSGKSFCSTLAFSPDGRYVYAANRGADTIGVFWAEEDGSLRKLQDYGCGGMWPRHIDVTRDGRYLMAANQESGDVAVIAVPEADGLLAGQVAVIPFTAPSFVAEI